MPLRGIRCARAPTTLVATAYQQGTRVSTPSNVIRGIQRRTLIICLIAQNCSMGFALGSFGPLLASTEQHFGVSRAVAAVGMSVLILALGGLSPLLGGQLHRLPVRISMAVGALLGALGYWGLAITHSFSTALVMFALIGASVCLNAVLGPLVMISRWFETNRGKALGVVNLPVLLFLTPYIIADLLPRFGRGPLLGALATICAALVPLMLLLVEYPPAASARDGDDDAHAAAPEGFAAIMKRPAFWLLSIGVGIVAGGGTAFTVHIVPFGVDRQMSLPAAAALLSVYGGAGLFGSLLFGWICDRIGAASALVLSALCQALVWWGFLHGSGPLLYGLAALLGVCLVPLVTLQGAAISEMFDAQGVSRAMGYSYMITMPFMFGFAPAMGVMFDTLGGYDMPFLAIAGLLVLAAGLFYLMQHALRKPASARASATS
ncbi:MFS transporter [Caballeronia sp. AZ7_KS35]|uniref:MFS transporter n=1 Tax=Caballeronia sp. AZ7_KS35 TaxID=2921762 RepID=UPI002027E57B|nr:MFS transporter [Caballeronia sp. AZ7_KS35]